MLAKCISAVVLSMVALACSAETLAISTYGPRLAGGPNHGWWSNDVTNYDGNDNFITGHYADRDYRSFFSFDLSEVQITSLTEVLLQLPASRLMSGPVDLVLWDVTTDPVTVNRNSGINPDVYADLGSGIEYGRYRIDSAVMVWVPLNDAGMAALQATEGFFTIGLSAPGENYVFGSSEGSGPQLLLRGEVKMIPEPPVAGMLTAGLVLLAVVGSWRRREPGLFEPDGPEGEHL